MRSVMTRDVSVSVSADKISNLVGDKKIRKHLPTVYIWQILIKDVIFLLKTIIFSDEKILH